MEIINFLTIHVPWEGWLALAVATVLVLYVLHRTIGLQLSLVAIVGAIAGLAVLFTKARQDGYNLRKTDEDTADQQVHDDFEKIHRKNEGLNDGQLDQKNDPWLKP